MTIRCNVRFDQFRRRGHKRQRRQMTCEQLDVRLALDATASAAAALPWFDPAELTYSFAPDGTSLGNEQSSLFSELARTGTTEQWQDAIARAFNTWLGILGTSIQSTNDTGAPFGTFGPTQGDSRFGDIRIGAVPLAGNVMAQAIPHSIITQGSWAGDILFNANADWSELGQVYSVALHEFGHVLGLGHSDDPASPMFYHGVHDTIAPTRDDAAALQKLYAGVDVETEGHGANYRSSDDEDHWREQPEFQFDSSQALPLTGELAASARYTAQAELTATTNAVLYRLEPIGSIDHAQFLNIVVSATRQNGLIPSVNVFDSSGDPIRTRILHNSQGVLVVQARDVEPNQTYYVAVTPASTASQFQVGQFDFLAEYSNASLLPTEIGSYLLTAENPIVEQRFQVTSSRLIHLLVTSDSTRNKSANTAIWGTLVDSEDNIIAQVALNHGDARSAPLVFAEPGEYRLIVETGNEDQTSPLAARVKVAVDEISVDVGPGVIDPAIEPLVSCDSLGADPNYCYDPGPVVLVEGPVYPDPTQLPPTPVYPSLPPWSSPPWFYWPDFDPVYPIYMHNSLDALDVSGDQFVTPVDVLLIVNELNAGQPSGTDAFLDTNADGLVSPIDVLLVVNMLNSTYALEGELSAAADECVPSIDQYFFELGFNKRHRDFLALSR
ncbi:MAG: matrixin family metalloprotease [Planctomycetales bacterium]|nr:matrixin family metalloprotease [Planctomycetales bacterium]